MIVFVYRTASDSLLPPQALALVGSSTALKLRVIAVLIFGSYILDVRPVVRSGPYSCVRSREPERTRTAKKRS